MHQAEQLRGCLPLVDTVSKAYVDGSTLWTIFQLYILSKIACTMVAGISVYITYRCFEYAHAVSVSHVVFAE